MLTDPASEKFSANASCAARDTYIKWLSNHTIVCCMMKTTINDELSCKFDDAQSKEMIQLLNESFSISKDAERYKISYALFNIRM